MEPRGARLPRRVRRRRPGLGEITGEEGDTFTAGDLGDYEVGADGVVVLGDPTVFDESNIDDFDF